MMIVSVGAVILDPVLTNVIRVMAEHIAKMQRIVQVGAVIRDPVLTNVMQSYYKDIIKIVAKIQTA